MGDRLILARDGADLRCGILLAFWATYLQVRQLFRLRQKNATIMTVITFGRDRIRNNLKTVVTA